MTKYEAIREIENFLHGNKNALPERTQIALNKALVELITSFSREKLVKEVIKNGKYNSKPDAVREGDRGENEGDKGNVSSKDAS